MRHKHTLRAVTALARINVAPRDTIGDSRFEIDIIEKNVRRVAAKLLGNTLHRIGRSFRHCNATTSRAGEGHHIDIGM